MKRTRAVAILLDRENVLLMQRNKNGNEFFCFPGGGVDEGENAEQAAVRELEEETTMIGEIDRLLYVHEYDDGNDQYFYLIKNFSGTPVLPKESIEAQHMSSENFYKPQWVPLSEIPNIKLYPLEIRDHFLEDVENNFANCPRKAYIKIVERRS